MTILKELMSDYFSERPRKILREAPGRQVPITPSEQTWEHIKDPEEELQKLFTFKNSQQLIYFLEDVIQLQEAMKHHGKLLVDGSKVLIRINTKVMERVTDLDVEWAQKVDEIYADVTSQQ